MDACWTMALLYIRGGTRVIIALIFLDETFWERQTRGCSLTRNGPLIPLYFLSNIKQRFRRGLRTNAFEVIYRVTYWVPHIWGAQGRLGATPTVRNGRSRKFFTSTLYFGLKHRSLVGFCERMPSKSFVGWDIEFFMWGAQGRSGATPTVRNCLVKKVSSRVHFTLD